VLEQRDLSPLTYWRLNALKCPGISTTASYEGAGYAKLVVVLTCKSHDSANLTTGHLKTKTGSLALAPAIAIAIALRLRPTRATRYSTAQF
jgi:hypothetical protein